MVDEREGAVERLGGPIIAGKRSSCMKPRREGVAVWRLDEFRYAMSVDQVIRYVGSKEECDRRAAILLPKNTRDVQDRALARASYWPAHA
jgi:hypothetical protein